MKDADRAVRAGRRWRGTLAGVLLAVLLGGCASAAALRSGRAAEQQQDYDRAVVEYTRAVRLDPTDRTARQNLERVRLRASQEHYLRGRRLAAAGQLEEALLAFQIAAELNPISGEVDEHLRATRNVLRNRMAVHREGRTRLETLIEGTRHAPPPGLDLPPDIQMPDSLVFSTDTSSRDGFTVLARFADLNLIFDPDFRDSRITVDLRQMALADALGSLGASTRNFYRVTAPRTVTIIPDTPAKRREYEEEVVRTFYLSNADVRETVDLLRIVVDNRRLSAITATNAITIKDTPERIAAAARVIGAIDKARPEVVIDVELMEVDRTRLKEYGLQLASPGAPGISGQVDANREGLTLRSLRNLTQADIFVSNLPGLFYRLLKTDANTRMLASPHLRTSDGIPAQARFGERVPVPVTTFLPIATGGVQQQPITSFNYENIGVNIDILPRTHHDDEVSLTLHIEVSNISGTGFGGLPTFGNRAINTTIRLRDGETNMLAGLIRDDERDVLAGIPGLSDLPLVGRLFGHTRRESQETDIILTITPHIIRVLELTEADLRPFRVGRETQGAPTIELPLDLVPPADPEEAEEGEETPAQPIRPPPRQP
jgi:general secretion pathway protein D